MVSLLPPLALERYHNWSVVVADDDRGSLALAQMILEHHGFRVYCALNGVEAMRLIREVAPQFVITDIAMPEMDGWMLRDYMRQDPAARSIPVIALSAHGRALYGDRAVSEGFIGYLTKPITVDGLVVDLVRLLDGLSG